MHLRSCIATCMQCTNNQLMEYLYLMLMFLLHQQKQLAETTKSELFDSTARSSASSLTSLSLSFIVNSTSPGICYGGDSVGLGSTELRLEYWDNVSDFQWVEVANGIPTSAGTFNTILCADPECVWLRLMQEEHGGGHCNCWALRDVKVNNDTIIMEEEWPAAG